MWIKLSDRLTIGSGLRVISRNRDIGVLVNDFYVDDKLVSTDNYSSKSGSTIITFTKEYMSSLSEGEHTLRVAFNNGGSATTKFTVAKANTTSEETTETNENATTEDYPVNSTEPVSQKGYKTNNKSANIHIMKFHSFETGQKKILKLFFISLEK